MLPWVKFIKLIEPSCRALYGKKIVHNNQLIVNIKLDKELESKMHSEMFGLSITPDTLRCRKFSFDKFRYEDSFKYSVNEVTHYGISPMFIDRKYIEREGVKICKTDGGNSIASSKYPESALIKVKHHSLEIERMTKALDCLLASQGNKVVLVDLFERTIDEVNFSKGVPKVHTVVLYKNPQVAGKHEIVVIDPSNFRYSSHLKHINVNHPLLKEIITIHKGINIYTAKDKKQVGVDAYRDCVDISVKIAFGLEGLEEPIDLQKIKSYDSIISISNNDKIDKNIIRIKHAVRIKQASDVKIVEKYYNLQRALNQNIKLLKIKNLTKESKELLLLQKKAPGLGIEYSKVLGSLLDYNSSCIETLSSVLQEEHKSLMGAEEKDSE